MTNENRMRVWTKAQIGDKSIEKEIEIDNMEYLSQESRMELIERVFTTKMETVDED